MAIHVDDRHPQDAIDAAPPGTTIVADPAVEHTVDAPITITTPDLTVRGLTLRLADGAGENLVEVGADGVTLADFTIDGNRSNQPGERLSNGVQVSGASNVTLAGGHVRDVSRHGLRIVDESNRTSHVSADDLHVEGGPVADVTVRDVRVDRPRRDGCSVEGPDLENVSVENVRTYGSSDRGSVEVKDGASDAFVANCHAEDCVYGVAVQDHGSYPPRNVRIVGNTAADCETLVDAQTSHPPEGVAVVANTGRSIGGDGMGGPGGIHMHLIDGLVVADNVVDTVDGPGIAVADCRRVVVSSNVVDETAGAGILLADVEGATVGQNSVDGADGRAITCRGGEQGSTAVQVSDNRCSGPIGLEGDVDRYMVTDNVADGPVADEADGDGLVGHNLT